MIFILPFALFITSSLGWRLGENDAGALFAFYPKSDLMRREHCVLTPGDVFIVPRNQPALNI
jgi:hypothetical protein